MVFAKAADIQNPPSLREQVERSISAAITAGQLEPGELLTVPTLASDFEVSATPVREALLELDRRGFLDPVKDKGFRVTDVSYNEIESIAHYRFILDPSIFEDFAYVF